MSGAIVDNCSTEIVPCIEGSRLKGSKALQCGAAVFTEHTKYFRWSIFIILSITQIFRGVDTAYTKHYTVISEVDSPYTKHYAVFLEGRYYY